MAIKLDATADNIELKTYRIQDLENVNSHDEGYPTALAAKLYADKFRVTIDTELSETSENPVQNKVITDMLYDHELSIATIEESSYFKEFGLWSEQTLETEVSSVEVNFYTSAIGAYPTELLVTLIVPPPTQTLAYVMAELECAGGSKSYFVSCGGDGSGVVIKPDTSLNFCGGFRFRLSSPFACCTTWGHLSKSVSPYGALPKVGYGVQKLNGKTEKDNHFKKLTLRASGGTSILLPVGTQIKVYFK